MAARPQPAPTQHRAVLYARPLSPKLLSPVSHTHGESLLYAFDLYALERGHALCVQTPRGGLTEVIAPVGLDLPPTGIVAEFACSGAKNMQHLEADLHLSYSIESGAEHLTNEEFLAECEELRSARGDDSTVVYDSQSESGRARVSVLVIGRLSSELHLSAVHADGDQGVVIRTVTLVKIGK